MNIVSLATSLDEVNSELEELEIDMFASKQEIKEKEEKRREIINALLFYDEFEDLYKTNEALDIDNTLLYPFKEIVNSNGEKEFVRKSQQEYKEDAYKYLDAITNAFNNGEIDRIKFEELKQKSLELVDKQMDRVEEEEKKQEEEIDISYEHEAILKKVEDTKKEFIMTYIGEESYNALSYKYKNMQEVERKALLYKAHTGLCSVMGVTSNIDFTKYDFNEDQTVGREGYCIKTKDINSVPYPLDTILLEQTFKLYISQVMKTKEYTPKQKEDLTKLLYDDLTKQKQLILDKIKKRELTPYGC